MPGVLLADKEAFTGEAPLYEPGIVEKTILEFVDAEYVDNFSRMGLDRERMRAAELMASARFQRDPGNPDPLSKLWMPFTELAQKVKRNALLRSVIPDPFLMNMVRIQFTQEPSDEFKMWYSAQTGWSELTPQIGIPPQEVRSEVEGVVTAYFREKLRTSNFYDYLDSLTTHVGREGFCVGVVEKKYATAKKQKQDPMSPDEMALVYGDSDADDGALEANDDPYANVEFAGPHFVSIPPLNITVGDLQCDKGISGLPSFAVYIRRMWREMYKSRIQFDDLTGERISGCYANLEHLRPPDAGNAPSEQEAWTGYNAPGIMTWNINVLNEQGPANKHFQCVQRLGKFHAEDVKAFREMYPTKKEWRKFREKFGISEDDLATCENWIIEWTSPSIVTNGDTRGPMVLTRFEPWKTPEDPVTGSMVVEVRHHVIENRTLGVGDYAIGAGQSELLANFFLYCLRQNTRRTAEPMWAVDLDLVDSRYRQLLQDGYNYEANKMFPMAGGAGGVNRNLFTAIAPPAMTVEMAQFMMSIEQDNIQRIVGTAPFQQGGDDESGGKGNKTATYAVIASNELQKSVEAGSIKIEIHAVLASLKQALALCIDELRERSATPMTVSKEDLALFGDRYKGMQALAYVITPEMVMGEFGVMLLTSTSTGDPESRLTRRERFATMARLDEERLMQQGAQVNWKGFYEGYGEDIGIQEPLLDFQMPPAMPVGPGAGAAPSPQGNPGGAGVPRPEYDRPGPEISAPGEAMAGEPTSGGHPQAVTEGMMEQMAVAGGRV